MSWFVQAFLNSPSDHCVWTENEGTVSLEIRIAITDLEHTREREIGKSGYALRFW